MSRHATEGIYRPVSVRRRSSSALLGHHETGGKCAARPSLAAVLCSVRELSAGDGGRWTVGAARRGADHQQTISRPYQTSSRPDQTSRRPDQTRPDQLQTRPDQLQTRPDQLQTRPDQLQQARPVGEPQSDIRGSGQGRLAQEKTMDIASFHFQKEKFQNIILHVQLPIYHTICPAPPTSQYPTRTNNFKTVA